MHSGGGRQWRLHHFLWSIVILGAIGAAGMARAADGHDHGGGATTITVAPRVEARMGDQQVVLVFSRDRLFAFLERFTDGTPTRGAEVAATVNFLTESLVEIAPGVYQSEAVALSGGRNDIELSWRLGEREETATLTLRVPLRAASSSGLENLPQPDVPGWAFLVAAIAVYAGVTVVFWRRSRRQSSSRHVRNDPHSPASPHPAE